MTTVYVILALALVATAPPAMALSPYLSHDAPFDPLCLESAGAPFDASSDDNETLEPLTLLAAPGLPTALGFPTAGSVSGPIGFRGPPPAPGQKFASSFAMIGGFEMSLLVTTMMLPKSFTGWEDDFFSDGVDNLGEAWSRPPVWDTDHWFHNYVGHPYGGSIYYNTLRARGGTPFQSLVFSATMSTWWEYALEAVAERPSIQDLVITPVAGSLLGEFTHRLAIRMRKDGSGFAERIFLTVLNPTHMIFWRGD